MCKQQDLYFECGDKIVSRLSTCNFRKTGLLEDGKTRWKACMSYSYIARDIPGLCSSCYRRASQTSIEFAAEVQRLSMIGTYDDPDAKDPDVWKAEQMDSLMSSLPTRQAARISRKSVREVTWQTRKRTGRRSSLLSNEFKADEVVGHDDWETRLVSDDEPPTDGTTSAWTIVWDDSDEIEHSPPQLDNDMVKSEDDTDDTLSSDDAEDEEPDTFYHDFQDGDEMTAEHFEKHDAPEVY